MIHFYCFHNTKTILVSDLPVEKIKAKHGHKYEILTSVREKGSVDIIAERVKKGHPGFTFTYQYLKERAPISEEARKKISQSKLGKPRDEQTRLKISQGLKGRSNFQGKQHNIETKEVMSEKKRGNAHTKGYHWVHDPRGSEERRVKTRLDVPVGFQLGRDYYSTEAGLYYFKTSNSKSQNQDATNFPMERQTSLYSQDD
jgi:hypothetical protein